MGRKLHRARVALCVVVGVVAVITVALQLVLSSSIVRNAIDKAARENIDATLGYSSLDISLFKEFPALSLTLDDVSLTYPHDRFAAYDSATVRSRMLSAGRGESVDTLARFRRLHASVNIWRILGGKVRVREVSLDGLGVYAHQYGEGVANWNVFRSSSDEKEDETPSEGISLPWISVGEVSLGRHPRVIFTNQADTVFAALRADRLALGGDVRLNTKRGRVKFRKVFVDIDTVRVHGRLPADTIAFSLDRLDVGCPSVNQLELSLAARALARTSAFGRIEVPLSLDGCADVDCQSHGIRVNVPSMDALVAYVPLYLNGYAVLSDSTYVKAVTGIKDCDLGHIIDEYGTKFTDLAREVHTDARLDLKIEADGYLSESQVPAVEACMTVPNAWVRYDGMDVSAMVDIDLDASLSPSKRLDLEIEKLNLRSSGVKLGAEGELEDLLGADPHFDLSMDGFVKADSLMKYLPKDLGIAASGRVDMKLEACARKSQLNTYNFDKARVEGFLNSEGLRLSMPKDSIDLVVGRPDLLLSSDANGIQVDFNLDSLTFLKGSDMRAKIRHMENDFTVCKVLDEGKRVPRVEFVTNNGHVFFRGGANRAGLRNLSITAAIQKRVQRNSSRRRHFMDSLQRVYPGVPRDELIAHSMKHSGRQMPDYLKDKSFSSSDISVQLDSSLSKFFREWNPSGSIKADGGFASTPALPLRTRLSAVSGDFNGDVLNLDTLGIVCGTSDLSAKASIKGIRRVLIGRKSLIHLDADVRSHKLNANELLVALEQGKKITAKSSEADVDESFVLDSISGVKPDSTALSLIVLPANLVAKLSVNADNVLYQDVVASPMKAHVNLQGRTLQLTDTRLDSNYGTIEADAFYSTITRKKISAGFDLRLSDVSASGIIHLLPSVDEMMPALKSFDGSLGCNISATTQLDTCMNIIMPTLDGMIRVTGQDLTVNDLGPMKKIARLLLFKNTDVVHVDDLYVEGVIHKNRLEVFPFELGIDRYRFALQGVQGFDKSLNYHVSVMKSPLLIPFGVNMRGSLDKIKFSLGLAKFHNGKVPVYTEQLDTMQINLAASIKDIFRRGAAEAIRMNHEYTAEIGRRSYSIASSLGKDEFYNSQIDSLIYDMTSADIERSINEETEAVLSDVDEQTAALAKSLEAMTPAERRRLAREAKKNQED